MFNLNALITLTVFNLIALVQIAANVLVPTKLQRGPVLAAASICLATALCVIWGTASAGCFISKKETVVEDKDNPRVSHEKTIETERPAVEREKTTIERRP